MLPPPRIDCDAPAVARLQKDQRLNTAGLAHRPDAMNGHSGDGVWDAYGGGCGKEQLVVLAAVQRQAQRIPGLRSQRTDGQRGFVNRCGNARLLAEVRQIRREPIADVDRRVSQLAQAVPTARRGSG